MRRKMMLLCALLSTLLITPFHAYAATGSEPRLEVNGVEVEEIVPLVDEGTILVPVRALFEKLGYTVTYNSDRSVEVLRPGESLNLSLDSHRATINGIAEELAHPVILMNGRAFVPVEIFGRLPQMKAVATGDNDGVASADLWGPVYPSWEKAIEAERRLSALGITLRFMTGYPE